MKKFLFVLLLMTMTVSAQEFREYGDGTISQSFYGYDSNSKRIINENPFKIKDIINPKHYYYNGYSEDYSANVRLIYRVNNSKSGKQLSGTLEFNNSIFFVRGQYKGNGNYEATLYQKDKIYPDMWAVKGVMVWNVTNPKNVSLNITDKNFNIDFTMENYGSR